VKLSSYIFGTKGAQAVVVTLQSLGVDRVFGVPGIGNLELFAALADAPFATFTPANEGAAVFMANAHARVTGRIGVAVVATGAGLTNALTGIAEARLDSSPVLVLVGAGGGPAGKGFPPHQLDPGGVARGVAKNCFQPASAAEIPEVIRKAVRVACAGAPGPVVVDLPSAMLLERVRLGSPGAVPGGPATACDDQLDEAAARLRNSPAVGIYAGAGALGAREELKALAELLQAPVATTISGRGVLAEDHPLSVGFGFGRTGAAAAWRVFRRVETLLEVGCKNGDTATGAHGVEPPAEHLQINLDPKALGAHHPASLAVVADAAAALGGWWRGCSRTVAR